MYVSSRRRARRQPARAGKRKGALSGLFGPGSLGDIDIAFPPEVEAWRPLVESYAGDLPIGFLLAWIQRESGGNPCSYTSAGESGIFQLMPPDNIATAGTSVAALRAACVGSSQTRARALTIDEMNEQVRSGIQYVNAMRAIAHAKLDANGVDWGEDTPDFWQFVKLQHAYPGPSSGWLANAAIQLGAPPANWPEMRSTISGYDTVLNNAEWVGAFGAGGGTFPYMKYALGAAIAWGAYQILMA